MKPLAPLVPALASALLLWGCAGSGKPTYYTCPMDDLPPAVPVVAEVERCEVQADTVRVAGIVTDGESAEGLPAANVFTPDRRVAAATDIDGRFMLDGLTRADTIRVSFIGYVGASYSVRDLVSAHCAPAP